MREEGVPSAIHPGAFPVDPGFPQLEVASDPARMLEIFRAHLKPVAGKNCRVLDCRPFRFRCRQSTSRCVLQYTLRLEEPGTGRQWDQWVTGLIYAEPGEAERLWRSLGATDPAREVPELWRSFEPTSFIPELDMAVEVFPYDRRLPQLGRVLDGAMRELEPLLLASLGPGQWRAAPPTVEPTRYRTEMGAVLRYGLLARESGTGRSETLRCYVKVYRNQRGEETFERLRSWTREARQGYGLVRPIAYWSELRTLVLEEAPGISLQEVLRRDGDPLAVVRAAAGAAAAFNQDDLGVTRSCALPDQLDQLKRATDIVLWACPEMRVEVQAIAAAVVAGLSEVPPRPIHADLKPDHVFLSDGRVVFVDLDSVVLGDPVRDPAHFCSYLLGRVGLDTLSRTQARALAGAFADSYFSHTPPDWRRQFPLHCAGALIEVACGIFRHQKPRWREGATIAVEEALYVLSGGLR
jgi:phosphotransferase family enzyme